MIEKALELLELMKKNPKLTPNLVTYNTILDAAVSQNSFILMKKIYTEMTETNVGVDLITVSTYIKGLFRAGEPDEAIFFFNKIRSNKSVQVDLSYLD